MHKLVPDFTNATVLLYGDTGVGKTSLAATAPGPILFLDTDKGTMPLLHVKEFADKVRVEDIKSPAHLDKCIANLRGIGAKDWSKRFKTVVIDDLASVQGMVMEELGAADHAKDERRDQDDSTQKSYGIMGNRMRRYMRQLKQTPMHRIFICQMAPDKETGLIRPGLVGGLRHQLGYFTDALVYMRVIKDGRRAIYLEGNDTFLAKTRAWWLPKKVIIKPGATRATFTQLFALIAKGPARAEER